MASVDLARANRFDCVAYEFIEYAEEALHVRELEARVDRGVVPPNGMNEERAGAAFFFVEMNVDATRLRASWFQNTEHLGAQPLKLARPSVKANENVERQST